MPKIKILLAEDEASLAMIVRESLETKNFEVTVCDNGDAALKQFYDKHFDLLVLDVMMPKKDGFSVAKGIRKTDKRIPIIFLTAKSQPQDVVEGFHAGAQDYLKKPFSMQELIVRIESLLGRISTEKNDAVISLGNYLFHPIRQILEYDGDLMPLTHRESALLELLIDNRNEILDRSAVLRKIWGDDDFFNGRSMDVFITKLRKKLSRDASIQILNVRGLGYKLLSD